VKPSNDIIFYSGRHGRTAANEKDIYRSWSNAPEAQLSDEGKKDAEGMGKFFKNNLIPIHIIITDDLDRTHQTAKIVADILGIAEVFTTPKLRPLNMGDWTLKSKQEYPIDEFLQDTSKKIPGGESIDDFDDRQSDIFGRILKQIAKKTPNGFVLIVCHGSNNSFLNNRWYFPKDKAMKVGYEGLVNPGGVVMATDSELCPLTNIRHKDPLIQISKNFELPRNHEPGMKVPKGGSSCASCEYLGDDKKTCKNEYFIKWNGSDKLPAPADSYCSDWYQEKK
jgi:broad specificity phosphatase PhoE